ncbi:hypothetical protein EDD21DRAFT_151048 [Dissophora ornata]|nr:hypothetical protein EDD21DRAFT_151048 [Dissophora ornata]
MARARLTNHSGFFKIISAIASKRDREEDAESSSKRPRLDLTRLKRAIAKVKLTGQAVVNGRVDLSRLNNNQRVALLGVLGEDILAADDFDSLVMAAVELRNADIGELDEIKAPLGSSFPVVQAGDLYVRQTYKELYGDILKTFEKIGQKQIVVTGTSGIGKSVFLVYLVIRLLVESDADNPPIIVFHTKQSKKCFAFGGCSTVRSGDIEDFAPFLSLPDTWYLVDSSPEPVLNKARTVIAASPKTLFSGANPYQDVDKDVAWRYYMAPWSLEELTTCRTSVADFNVVPFEMMEELYSRIGGIPRYVLARPMKELGLSPSNLQVVIERSSERLVHALDNVDDPVKMMQLFAQGKDSLDFSSRLVHRWPVGDHRTFRLEWASTYVAEKVADLLNQNSCTQMLEMLIKKPDGSASGIIFEAYVLRTFRDGGHTFELKDLQTGKTDRLIIPRKPDVMHFQTITSTKAGQLWIPTIHNFACVDMLLSPRDLLQITVSKTHPIKGPPLLKLVESLVEHSWIAQPKEARLIFVVPGHVFADFRKQNYLTSAEKVYKKVPADIKSVKQYVLKIDVKAAAAGKSPGLEIPTRQVTPKPRKRPQRNAAKK